MKTLSEIQYNIINQYKSTIDFRVCSNEVAYCYVPEKIVYIYNRNLLYPSVESLFDLLHEIGHIMTNTSKMKRCEEEYYATQWAMKEIKSYDLNLPEKRKQEFQDYIYKWRETGIKLNGKNMPDKKQLTLVW